METRPAEPVFGDVEEYPVPSDVNDPPLTRTEPDKEFLTLEEVIEPAVALLVTVEVEESLLGWLGPDESDGPAEMMRGSLAGYENDPSEGADNGSVPGDPYGVGVGGPDEIAARDDGDWDTVPLTEDEEGDNGVYPTH